MEKAIIIAASVLAASIAIAFAAFGAALADGNVTSKALECMARQPEEKSSLQINMLISVGLIESIPIIAAVIAIVLVMANPFVK